MRRRPHLNVAVVAGRHHADGLLREPRFVAGVSRLGQRGAKVLRVQDSIPRLRANETTSSRGDCYKALIGAAHWPRPEGN